MRRHQWVVVLMFGALLTTACADDAPTGPAADEPTTVEAPSDAGRRRATDSTTAPDIDSGPRATGNRPSGGPHGRPHTESTPSSIDEIDEIGEIDELAESDIAGLLWMREEEQLAHDVYTALGADWGLQIFDNIAASESTHTELVTALLERYGIEDPLAGAPAGTFTIPALQELYDELVDDGRNSLIDALEVGALIEEIDIVDLRAQATAITDIRTTYDQLERGSRNHLRAFTSQLAARDVVYEPTRLDDAAYDEIVSGAMERGA